jgi:hypothetical protein
MIEKKKIRKAREKAQAGSEPHCELHRECCHEREQREQPTQKTEPLANH